MDACIQTHKTNKQGQIDGQIDRQTDGRTDGYIIRVKTKTI